jgi:copper homeostasis protein
MKREACIETLAEAKVAAKHGIDRVELCSALDLGGLTPSAALMQESVKIIETHVMIRPRAGYFVYQDEELKLMQADIQQAANYGATGVVFGCLTDVNTIDEAACRHLLEAARANNLQVTFHRAFDFVFDMQPALEKLIALGFDRLLTSGGQATAIAGLTTIKKLVTQANGRIQIMAGSGVNSGNAHLFQSAGVDALHFSIRKKRNSIGSLSMGANYDVDEEKVMVILKTLEG